jgi:hypothetical protein
MWHSVKDKFAGPFTETMAKNAVYLCQDGVTSFRGCLHRNKHLYVIDQLEIFLRLK